jgi:uncharacterized protein YkwD
VVVETNGSGAMVRRLALRLAAGALAASVGLVGLQTGTASAGTCSPSSVHDDATKIKSIEAEAQKSFVKKLNDLRSSKGLRTLAVNSGIIPPAVDWSETMAAQNWLHHARDTGPDDGVAYHQDYVRAVGAVVPNWTRVAENVGVSGLATYCDAETLRTNVLNSVSSLHNAFVNSSGHYANMVGDHNQQGVGVHVDLAKVWVTVRFAKGDLPLVIEASTVQYLDSVYNLFVKRNATSTEDAKWADAVQSGKRYAVTSALAVSDEWAGVRVNDLYRKVLGRDADAAGRAFWVKKIAAGMRLEDVAAAMYASPEYFDRKGGTNKGFIKGLYQDILHRSADLAGLDHWTSLLHWKLIDRQGAAASFYASIESRRDRVTTLYKEILGRGTDTAGRDYWAKQLLTMGDVVLASQLASSLEYFKNATS